MKRALLFLLLLGCEEAASKAVRDTLTASLTETKGLVFKQMNFPADGGSKYFLFETDQKKSVGVTVVHQFVRKEDEGKPQVIRLDTKGNDECDLRPYSGLEKRLLELIDHCTIAEVKDPTDLMTPTRERALWLIGRINNRDRAWSDCPRPPGSP